MEMKVMEMKIVSSPRGKKKIKAKMQKEMLRQQMTNQLF